MSWSVKQINCVIRDREGFTLVAVGGINRWLEFRGCRMELSCFVCLVVFFFGVGGGTSLGKG